MIDGYFAVARQKGSDKDRRAALIWITLLETFSTKVFWKCTARRRIPFVEVFGNQYAPLHREAHLNKQVVGCVLRCLVQTMASYPLLAFSLVLLPHRLRLTR